jgi:hypothetical protein
MYSTTQQNNLNIKSNQITKTNNNFNFTQKVSLKQQNIIGQCSNFLTNAQEISFGSPISELYLAGGAGTNTLAYSYDGIKWIGRGTTLFKNYVFSIAWNGIIYVLHEQSGSFFDFYYSYNGFDWTVSPTTDIMNSGCEIAYGLSIFVAVGSYNGSLPASTIAYSVDGITWIGLGTTIFGTYGYGIICNGTIFVACGGLSPYTLAYSADGKIWIGVTGSPSLFNYARNGCWDGEKFVVCGYQYNNIAYSYDGIKWTGVGTILVQPDKVTTLLIMEKYMLC